MRDEKIDNRVLEIWRHPNRTLGADLSVYWENESNPVQHGCTEEEVKYITSELRKAAERKIRFVRDLAHLKGLDWIDRNMMPDFDDHRCALVEFVGGKIKNWRPFEQEKQGVAMFYNLRDRAVDAQNVERINLSRMEIVLREGAYLTLNFDV